MNREAKFSSDFASQLVIFYLTTRKYEHYTGFPVLNSVV